METHYTYSILRDTPNGKVSIDRLHSEIVVMDLGAPLSHINRDGDALLIYFPDALGEPAVEQLTGVVGTHTGDPLIAEPKIITIEDRQGVAGWYQTRGMKVIVAPGEIGEGKMTWPYPIRLCTMTVTGCGQGDWAMGTIGENTPVGTIIDDVHAGDTVFKVSKTVVENVEPGFGLTLFAGTIMETFMVTKRNIGTQEITVEHPSSYPFSAASPAICLMTYYMTHPDGVYLAGNTPNMFGYSLMGGSLIPAGTELKFRYKNNQDHETTAIFLLETWY